MSVPEIAVVQAGRRSRRSGDAPDGRPPWRAVVPQPHTAILAAGALLGCLLLALLVRDTVNVPLAEDWHMVPPLTGHEPDLWRWLWEQNNEHRLPLPRLVLLGILWVTGDFRAGMLASLLLLVGVSWALVRGLAALRGGRLRYTDVFVPVALLHLGNWENVMWAWQIGFVLSTVLALVLLATLAGPAFWSSQWRPPATGATIAALPLCGANGLALAAPVCAWLVWEAALIWRRDRTRRRAAAWVLGGAALALAAALYYVAGYASASWNPPSPGPLASLRTALAFLAMGIGPAIVRAPGAASVAVLVALVPALAIAARAAARAPEPDARLRALRLLSFAAGMIVLALLFGWGRAGLVPSVGLPDRYVLLAVPALMWVYVAADLYAARQLRRTLQGGLLMAALAMLPWNVKEGLEWRAWYREGMQQVIADTQAGMPRTALVERHGTFLMHWNPERLAAALGMLRDAGIGPLADLQE